MRSYRDLAEEAGVTVEAVRDAMGRGMDPMSAYERAEREEHEEHRKRMERLRGAKPERRGGR